LLSVDPALPAQRAQEDLAPILETFARDGYAALGRVLSAPVVAALGARLDDLMTARVRYDGMFFQLDAENGRYEDLRFGLGWQGPSTSYRKIEKLELDPLFLDVIKHPHYERIARALIPGPIALYRAVVFTKSAVGGTELPWHQDGGDFWGIDRPPALQIWTALDDAPIEAGCVEAIAGSHARGLATPQGGTIPETLVAEDLRSGRSRMLPARAGEAYLIHNHVWHRSGRNTTGRRRAALSICYMSASTRCLRRRRAPRSFLRLFT
jgi:hypothetical protein